uniref:THAP domain-containing protein 1 n=1 Tax=Acanthochromis polyacanthus TaxID=80966 RepID=A0A3Q1FRH9_9TELE
MHRACGARCYKGLWPLPTPHHLTVISTQGKHLSFHTFPVDAAVLAEWMQKIRREHFNPTKNTRVCSRHFKKTDFSATVGGLRKLKKGSVPSACLHQMRTYIFILGLHPTRVSWHFGD